MRLGVIDIGSNTVHLLIVDAHPGAAPVPMDSIKVPLRLASALDSKDRITRSAIQKLSDTILEFSKKATELDCENLLAFATSAVRDAANCDEVLTKIFKSSGVTVKTLTGSEEASITYRAVRRWSGYGSGRILTFDIGGGSLEVAIGDHDNPEHVKSIPIGTGRLTKKFKLDKKINQKQIEDITGYLDENLSKAVEEFQPYLSANQSIGTSKTFKTLARITGNAPAREGLYVPRSLSFNALNQVTYFVSHMEPRDLHTIDGVNPDRADQLVAGAFIALSAMKNFAVKEINICPWALREGIILHYLDTNFTQDFTI